MRLLAFILVALSTGAGGALAQDGAAKALAKTNVALFDELKACSQKATFRAAGLARTGPCGSWVDRVEAQQRKDSELIKGGYMCLAGDIRMAGLSAVSGDREHFNFVAESVDECRRAVR